MDMGDGTVRDTLTGLIWLKDAYCLGSQDWQGALEAAKTLNSGECGLTDSSVEGDWRLPNINELRSLIDPDMTGPKLPGGHPFINVNSSFYWSGTTTASFTGGAWGVEFNGGGAFKGGKGSGAYVWPVRGGQ